MSKPRGFPRLQSGEFAVAFADTRTGVIVTPDGAIAGGNPVAYEVFEDLAAARERARVVIASNPFLEGVVLDAGGDVVLVLERVQ